MNFDEDRAPSVPDWMVTYGDLMSLLLTFFVMLVSMSELKQNDKFQGVADSLAKQFGSDQAGRNEMFGEGTKRHASLAALAVPGRNRRKEALRPGPIHSQGPAAEGKVPVMPVVPSRAAVAVAYFPPQSADLGAENKQHLRQVRESLHGKDLTIEVCGYATVDQQRTENWDLAYRQASNVAQWLIAEGGVAPQQIRLSIVPSPVQNGSRSGADYVANRPTEPIAATSSPPEIGSRVEINVVTENKTIASGAKRLR